MVLLAHTDSIFSFIIVVVMLYILNFSLNTSLRVWQEQDANKGSKNSATVRGIASIIYTGLRSKSSNCQARFSLTTVRHPYLAKLKSIFF